MCDADHDVVGLETRRARRLVRDPSRNAERFVKKTVLLYGVLGGLLIAVLKLTEYRFLVVERSVEIYGGIVAALFAALGLWLGARLTRGRDRIVIRETPVEIPSEAPGEMAMPATSSDAPPSHRFVPDAAKLDALRITPRELEILELIAAGLSTREIAARLYVSENTVKTHASRLFDKLQANRRTQAVQLAKQAGIIA